MVRSTQRGASAVELLAVVAMFVALVLATGPPLLEAVRSSRVGAGARQLAGELQLARSNAVATGWQHRIVGYSGGSSNTRRNQFRMMARRSPLTSWPATDSASFEDASVRVGDWVDLGSLYHGVSVSPTDVNEFWVNIDVRGTPFGTSLNFNPLQVSGEYGTDKWLTISAVGNVRIE